MDRTSMLLSALICLPIAACNEEPNVGSGPSTQSNIIAHAPSERQDTQSSPRRDIAVVSKVENVTITLTGNLPLSPEVGTLEPACEHYHYAAIFDSATQVSETGWIVTSEAPLGELTVISFASGFDPGTSAMCFARNAKLAVFRDDQLIALVEKVDGSSEEAGHDPSRDPLGELESLESGALLAWSGPAGKPLGELHWDGETLGFKKVSAKRTFCKGRVTVPNIYGQPISAARESLFEFGWVASLPDEEPGPYDRAADLAKFGIAEAQACSGTGLGYCGFGYRQGDITLGVSTVGDFEPPKGPIVSHYSVSGC